MQSPHEQRKIVKGGSDLSQEHQTPRTATRAPLSTPVRLQFDDSIDVVEARCENISIGGMQVLMEDPRPQGSRVRFELEIDEGLTIRGLGEVIWSRSLPGHEIGGMGIKFRFLEQLDRQAIFKLVSEHIKERLEQKHPSAEPVEEKAVPPITSLAAEPPSAELSSAAPIPAPSPVPPSTAAFDAGLMGDLPLDSPLASPSPAGLFSGGEGDDEFPRRGTMGGLPQSSSTLDEAAPGRTAPEEEDFYRPRPVQRRDFPILPIAVLLLVAGIVAAYFGWDRFFGPPTPPTLGQTAEVPPTATSPEEVPPEGAPPATGEAPPPPITEPPPFSVESTPDRPPPPPSPAPRPPTASPPPSPSPPPPRRPFTRVLDISWTRLPGGVKVEIETDGAIPEGRFRRFRLEGESPREVVQLNGVVESYPSREISVSGAPVSRIRIGYHDNRELHVVLDMLDRTSRVSRIRQQGNKLIVIVE